MLNSHVAQTDRDVNCANEAIAEIHSRQIWLTKKSPDFVPNLLSAYQVGT